MAGSKRPFFRLLMAPTLAFTVLASGACDDNFFTVRWDANPATISLFSLARPELNLPSAFNMNKRTLVEIEQSTATGTWDLAVDTQNGEMVFLTPRVMGIESDAGITLVEGTDFDALASAPGDTARYYNTEPVKIEVGRLYVVRTIQGLSNFGQVCNFFGKLQPLSIDLAVGTVEFKYDSNPVCNNRELIPPN